MKRIIFLCLFIHSAWLIQLLHAQDTVVLSVDTTQAGQVSKKLSQSEDTLLTRKISQALINLIRKEQASQKQKDFSQDDLQFSQYENMLISSIRVIRLEPFGPTLEEPGRKAVSFFEKSANKLHFRTQESIIRNNLLFKEGSDLDPYTIADNERVLRSLPFIEDARIIVSEIPGSQNEAEIIIVTKDVFPFGFSFDISSTSKGNVDTWNNNIFGFGHVLRSSLYWNTNTPSPFGYFLQYRVKNVASTFTDLEIEYIDRFGTKGYKANLTRPFFTPETKYAGGLSYENMQLYESYWTFDTTYLNAFTDYYRFDNWLARAVRLDHTPYSISKYRTSIVIAARWMRDSYDQTPSFVSENMFRTLQSRDLLLGSLSFIRQNFIKTNYIYSFGRTEDLPYGYNITFIGGLESGVYKNRSYLALQTSGGKYHYRMGYLYGRVEAGTFLANNHYEQAVFQFRTLYFSHLFGSHNYRFRIFKRMNYTKGMRLYDNEFLSIEQNQGIAGLRSEALRGTEKLTVNLESVLFTPWKPLNFRLALFAFTDWGIVNNEHKLLFNNRLHQNIGIGFRFRNENLVFNTIEFRLTYFFYTPDDASAQYYLFSGEPRLRSQAFYSRKPTITNL